MGKTDVLEEGQLLLNVANTFHYLLFSADFLTYIKKAMVTDMTENWGNMIGIYIVKFI